MAVQHRLVNENNQPIPWNSLERHKPVVVEVSHVKYLAYHASNDETDIEITYVAIQPEGRSYSIRDRALIRKNYRKRTES